MKDLGNLNNWTKNDLARVIVQALMNLDEPARADSRVVKREERKPKARLVKFAAQAIEIINRNKMEKLKD
jgi:hypothetical protein